jgi:hypothetical protein
LGPIPNPQSPIPNPHSPNLNFAQNLLYFTVNINLLIAHYACIIWKTIS